MPRPVATRAGPRCRPSTGRTPQACTHIGEGGCGGDQISIYALGTKLIRRVKLPKHKPSHRPVLRCGSATRQSKRQAAGEPNRPSWKSGRPSRIACRTAPCHADALKSHADARNEDNGCKLASPHSCAMLGPARFRAFFHSLGPSRPWARRAGLPAKSTYLWTPILLKSCIRFSDCVIRGAFAVIHCQQRDYDRFCRGE